MQVVGVKWFNDCMAKGRLLPEHYYFPINTAASATTTAPSRGGGGGGGGGGGDDDDAASSLSRSQPDPEPTSMMATATASTSSSQPPSRAAKASCNKSLPASTALPLPEPPTAARHTQLHNDLQPRPPSANQEQTADAEEPLDAMDQELPSAPTSPVIPSIVVPRSAAREPVQPVQPAQAAVLAPSVPLPTFATTSHDCSTGTNRLIFGSMTTFLAPIRAVILETQYSAPDIEWIRYTLGCHGSRIVTSIAECTHIFTQTIIDPVCNSLTD
jgi:hypothetical protein